MPKNTNVGRSKEIRLKGATVNYFYFSLIQIMWEDCVEMGGKYRLS